MVMTQERIYWRYLPYIYIYIRPTFQGYVREYPQNALYGTVPPSWDPEIPIDDDDNDDDDDDGDDDDDI